MHGICEHPDMQQDQGLWANKSWKTNKWGHQAAAIGDIDPIICQWCCRGTGHSALAEHSCALERVTLMNLGRWTDSITLWIDWFAHPWVVAHRRRGGSTVPAVLLWSQFKWSGYNCVYTANPVWPFQGPICMCLASWHPPNDLIHQECQTLSTSKKFTWTQPQAALNPLDI